MVDIKKVEQNGSEKWNNNDEGEIDIIISLLHMHREEKIVSL